MKGSMCVLSVAILSLGPSMFGCAMPADEGDGNGAAETASASTQGAEITVTATYAYAFDRDLGRAPRAISGSQRVDSETVSRHAPFAPTVRKARDLKPIGVHKKSVGPSPAGYAP